MNFSKLCQSYCPEISPVLSHCSIWCFSSLLGPGDSGLSVGVLMALLSMSVITVIAAIWIWKTSTEHQLIFFPSPWEVHMSSTPLTLPEESPGLSSALTWPHNSAWPEIAALALAALPKNEEKKVLPSPEKALLNYVCHRWEFFSGLIDGRNERSILEREIHFASLKYLWSSPIPWF